MQELGLCISACLSEEKSNESALVLIAHIGVQTATHTDELVGIVTGKYRI